MHSIPEYLLSNTGKYQWNHCKYRPVLHSFNRDHMTRGCLQHAEAILRQCLCKGIGAIRSLKSKTSKWNCCTVFGKIMSQIYCLKHASFFFCFFYLFTSIPSSPFFHRSTPQPHPPLIRRWHHSCSNFLYYTSPHCRTTVIYSDTQTHPFMCNLFSIINNDECVARFWKCYGKHSLVMFLLKPSRAPAEQNKVDSP